MYITIIICNCIWVLTTFKIRSLSLCTHYIYYDSHTIGTYLGYTKSAKYREWIPELNPMALKKIEASSKSAEELAKALFLKIFKDDLEHRPNAICTTSNRLDGREQCDPTKLRGIRCMFVCLKLVCTMLGL